MPPATVTSARNLISPSRKRLDRRDVTGYPLAPGRLMTSVQAVAASTRRSPGLNDRGAPLAERP